MKPTNHFGQYWRSLNPGKKRQLALSANTSYNYLSLVANGYRGVGLNFGRRLANADPNIELDWFGDDEPLQATG